MSSALDVFFSYSHKDDDLREELEVHLALLKRQGRIRAWSDRRIVPGDEWAGKIDENLEKADIVLLLVSPSFLASDYCFDLEMQRAMERHEAGEARVIPIILRPLPKAWMSTPFSKLQVLPERARPVTSWPNRDEAFVNIVDGLDTAIQAELGRRQKAGPTSSGPMPSAAPSPGPPRQDPSRSTSSLPRLTCREMRDKGYLAEIASVFNTAAAADGLLEDAGIPRTRIAPFGQMAPIDFWAAVCRELEKGLIPEGPAALLAAAARAYPHNSVFRAATRV